MSVLSALLWGAMLVAVYAVKPATVTWSDCSDATYHTKITRADIPPNPTTGQNLTVVGYGNVDEPVTGGTYTLSGVLNGIPVLKHTHSVCGTDVVKVAGGIATIYLNLLTCPTAAGEHSISFDVFMTNLAPNGLFKATAKAVDAKGEPLLCLEIDVKIGA